MRRLAFLIPFALSALPAGAGCMFADNEPATRTASGHMLALIAQNCAEAGFDFDAPLPSGRVPFREMVVLGGSPEAVAIALEAGADPNITDKYGSPAFVDLINFSMETDDPALLEILRLLGEAGADFSLPDNQGDLALSKAAGGGETGTVRLLLAYGADPNGLNAYARTPLFETVFGRCSPEAGAALIDKGARLDPMPADQLARMFDEADKACAETAPGRDYVARLRAMRK
ncbi:MAG: ankyrin repeat domain-containing protein [Pikeienuella sp.]